MEWTQNPLGSLLFEKAGKKNKNVNSEQQNHTDISFQAFSAESSFAMRYGSCTKHVKMNSHNAVT
jgi:hypothetical protein